VENKGKVLVDGKTCPKCSVFKPLDSFHKDKTSKFGLAYYCKVCANSSSRKNHKTLSENTSWVLERRHRQKTAARESKLKAIEYLGNKCLDCGNTYPSYVYDIHHIDGDTKLDNPSRLLRGDWVLAKAELDKCVLLCANCHRERHFGAR
jgi:hypothetical protein